MVLDSPLAWFQAASPVLGSVLKPSGAGPSRAESSAYVVTDFGGLAVDFGSGSASVTAAASKWWIAAAALAAVGWIVWARKKA